MYNLKQSLVFLLYMGLGAYLILGFEPDKLTLHKYYLQTCQEKIYLNLEEARSISELSKGLSMRKKLPQNQGMLFVFNKPQILKFWMQNTEIPLDLFYLDDDMKIAEIHNLKPMDSTIITSKAPYKYALELNSGSVEKFSLNVGGQLVSVPE